MVSIIANLTPVLNFIKYRRNLGKNIDYILDLGCGWGSVGEFIKESFPDIVIDGIDIDEYSVSRAIGRSIFGVPVYRAVYLEDLRKRRWNVNEYDLFLAINVFDKMSKEDAFKIINSLKGRLIICLPIKKSPQGAVFGNPFTEIVSFLEHSEIMEFASKCLMKGYVYGLYLV